jgi:hypothetical protein
MWKCGVFNHEILKRVDKANTFTTRKALMIMLPKVNTTAILAV